MNKQQREEKRESVLEILRSVHENTQEALRELRFAESEIQKDTTLVPDFYRMFPEDIYTIHNDVRVDVIMALHRHGMSNREIERRLRGDSRYTISEVIKEQLKEAERKDI